MKKYVWFMAIFPLITGYVGAASLSQGDPQIITAFNQMNWDSDLNGDFKAAVSFAQSATIPAESRIAGDRHPHLTGYRETLILVKPQNSMETPQSLQISAAVKGVFIGELALSPPSELFLHDGSITGVDFSQIDFDQIDRNSIKHVSTAENFSKLANDLEGDNINQWLADANTVEISLGDGRFTHHIYLPKRTDHRDDNKTVIIESEAGYNSNIHFNDEQLKLSKGNQLIFKNYGGIWILNYHKKSASIVYSENTWSGILPSDWIQPGLEITVTDGKHSGYLTVTVGSETELIINTIDLGFLTSPRNEFEFAENEDMHADYFQRIPVTRFIVGQYEALQLDEVMLPDGTLLTNFDPSEGGWHVGTMRGLTGKLLISHGINNANYGLNASVGNAEWGHPYLTAMLTAHNSRGRYANGVQVHGGSGGAGIVTLDQSHNNEWSHEVGHNFGLGHYPYGAAGSIHHPADEPNSAWGWDTRHRRFITNFSWGDVPDKQTCIEQDCVQPFMGSYSFKTDPMASGLGSSKLAQYPIHTPFVMKDVQDFLESKAVFAAQSDTGFLKWNADSQAMEPFTHQQSSIVQYEVDINRLQADQGEGGAVIHDTLQTYNMALVRTADGSWVKNIYLPAPETVANGRAVKIEVTSSWGVSVHVNGDTTGLNNGDTNLYVKQGDMWQLMDPEIYEKSKLLTLKPEAFGVPVTTIVGYYDPETELNSYIYPALHGAYGFIYQDQADRTGKNDCQMTVGEQVFLLHNIRYSETMNKFHVNIPQIEQPTKVTVFCQGRVLASKVLQPPVKSLSYTVNGYYSKD